MIDNEKSRPTVAAVSGTEYQLFGWYVVWDGWQQFHDLNDPPPKVWDDDEPKEIIELYMMVKK